MRLRKLRITIVSSFLLFLSSIGYTKVDKVIESNSYYYIDVVIESINRSKDIRLATIKAKIQLSHFIKKEKSSINIEMKHFILIGSTHYSKEAIYRFKVNKNNIKFY